MYESNKKDEQTSELIRTIGNQYLTGQDMTVFLLATQTENLPETKNWIINSLLQESALGCPEDASVEALILP